MVKVVVVPQYVAVEVDLNRGTLDQHFNCKMTFCDYRELSESLTLAAMEPSSDDKQSESPKNTRLERTKDFAVYVLMKDYEPIDLDIGLLVSEIGPAETDA